VQPFVRGALTVLIVVASIELLGLGDPGVGLLNAAIGLGAIVGSVGTILLVGRQRLALVFLLALVVWGLPITVMGLVPLAGVAVAAMLVVGLANAVLDVAGFTTLQRIVPNDVRASVLGVFEGYVAAMAALGGIVAPVLIAAFGVSGALVATGLILPVAVAVAARGVLACDDISLVPERQCELLRGVAMFTLLPMSTIEDLAGRLQPVTFGPGETLMRAGDTGDRFLIIDDGTVEVEADGAQPKTMGPGSYCGEIALLRDVPRTATVRTVTDVSAFALSGPAFVAAVTGDREAVRSASRVVEARLANRPDEPA
jgi:MFS family permease